MIRRIEGDCSNTGDDPCSPSSKPYPSVSIGCVIFPVFVLVWYHYSKKKICSKFENVNDDDIICSSNGDFEIMERTRNGAENMLSDRFVKWINRRNVFATGFDEDDVYQLETTKPIETTLFGSCCIDVERDAGRNNTSKSNNNPSMIDKTTSNDDFENGIGVLFWECIPNVQDGGPFKLCSTTKQHAAQTIPTHRSCRWIDSILPTNFP
jgi:hypothetical protein